MEKLNKFIKKITLKSNIILALAGIILMIVIIFIYLNPTNLNAILIAAIACGIMNIIQAFKMLKDPKRKSMGLTYLMMGIIIIVVGFIIVKLG